MTTNDDRTTDVITQALRRARQGAADAGYGVEDRGGAERRSSDRRTAVVSDVGPGGVGAGDRWTKPTNLCDVDRIGVSVSLTGTQVLLDYPAEYRKLVAFPIAWLRFPTPVTDRLIGRHYNVEALTSIVQG